MLAFPDRPGFSSPDAVSAPTEDAGEATKDGVKVISVWGDELSPLGRIVRRGYRGAV
jgi:hypothetical protein